MDVMLTVENMPNEVLVLCRGQRLAAYRARTHASKPHFDVAAIPPTAQRRAGENVVLASPHDHVWHFGLFYAQKYIDKLNFWESEPLARSKAPHGRCVLRGDVETAANDDMSVRIAHAVDWVTNTGDVWISEERQIIIRPPVGDGWRMDWTLRFTATGKDRTLTSLSEYGDYSGLSYRSLRSMDRGNLLDSEGRTTPAAMLGQAARWADYSGKLDGNVDMDDPDWAGVAMFDHPANPDHPVRWFCMNEPFGFLAANRSMGRSWTLPAGKPVELRYGVYVHAGQATPAKMNDEYERFVREA